MYVLHLVTRNLGNENLKSLPQSVSSIFQQCSCTIPALPGPITRLCGGLCFGLFLGNLGRGLYGFARCGDTFAVDAKPTIIEPLGFLSGVLLPCVLNSNWFIDHFFDPLLGFVGSLASLALRTVNHQAPSSTSIWGWSMIQLCTSLWLIRGLPSW